jgi:hypothetical protein
MADAAIEERWTHTASIMALLANVHRTKGRAFAVEDFMPRRPEPVRQHDISVLRDIFCRRGS